MAPMAVPTVNAAGAVYVGAAGAVRSTVTVRVTSSGEPSPVFAADTVTVTLGTVT